MKRNDTLTLVRISALAATMALAFGARAQTNLIVNGNFEQTTLTQSGVIGYTNVVGWTSASPYNNLYFAGTADEPGVGALNNTWLWGPADGSNNGLTATSPAGGNYLSADADPAYWSISPIQQIVTGLTPGKTYDLTFDYAAGQYTAATGPTTNFWEVNLGGVLGQTQDTPTLAIASQGFSGWKQETMQFTAYGPVEVLTFLAKGEPSGFPPVSLLDGVSLVQDNGTVPPVSAVPEPSSLALTAVGMFALVGVLRRKRR